MKKAILTSLICSVLAAPLAIADSTTDLIEQQLQKINPRLQATEIKEAAIPNFYEVVLQSGEVLYVDKKAEFFMLGQLFQMSEQKGFVNLTETARNGQRAELAKTLNNEDMIIFPAKGERKTTIKVFTDVDCPYCRKLHAEVPALNDMGVEIAYLAYPRAGEGSQTYYKMQSIWCAEPSKRAEQMNLSKTGATLEPIDCKSPIMDQFRLGQQMGVSGTPAMLLEDGTLIPGYMTAAQIAQRLGL